MLLHNMHCNGYAINIHMTTTASAHKYTRTPYHLTAVVRDPLPPQNEIRTDVTIQMVDASSVTTGDPDRRDDPDGGRVVRDDRKRRP